MNRDKIRNEKKNDENENRKETGDNYELDDEESEEMNKDKHPEHRDRK